MAFVLLAPGNEAFVKGHIDERRSTSNHDPATEESAVGPLGYRLPAPVRAGENRIGSLLAQPVNKAVGSSPGGGALNRSDCLREVIAPDISVGKNNNVSRSRLNGGIDRSALAPRSRRGPGLEDLPVRVRRRVGPTQPAPRSLAMRTAAPEGHHYRDSHGIE